LRVQVAEVARQLHAAGWVANHDGNVTARDGARFLATPTATAKRLVGDRDLIEVDAKGSVHGPGKVFGEIGLHLVVYERRPDVHCVVHAHPPHATAISASRKNPIEQPFLAEAVVSLGPRIPVVPYVQPGAAARAALAPWCELVDAVLLGNHGAMAWGANPEQALLRLELVEHLARIALAALPLGGVEPLPDAAIAPLLAARAKAGLGHAADRAVTSAAELLRPSTPRPVVACAPAPHTSSVPTISPGGAGPRDQRSRGGDSSAAPEGGRSPRGLDLAAVVREEIVRALGKA
jgi:L-fuculose-phosphate aldolase